MAKQLLEPLLDLCSEELCVKGDEAVDEERRADAEQLPVEGGGQRHGQLYSPDILQAGLPGGLQVIYWWRLRLGDIFTTEHKAPTVYFPKKTFQSQ